MGATYAYSAWIFTRALCLIYFIAFTSVAVQARGLWGSRGVLPIQGYMEAISNQMDSSRYWQLPSVFWVNTSDLMITAVPILGALTALMAFAGFLQGWMLLICFALYLSLVGSGQQFMSFQWDALLLEVGFLALFAVPWAWRHGFHTAMEPHWAVRFMFYVVLFKLMFLSGVVKILSGDPSWRDFSALTYHYWTQPLPNPLSPFMHALPKFVHQFSTAMTFVAELFVPFLMFYPRTRALAFAAFLALSLLILTTGNYTFFNWLTIAISFWLLPDSLWEKLLARLPLQLEVVQASTFGQPAIVTAMAGLALLSLVWCTQFLYTENMLNAVMPILRRAQIFHISNSYGLFANMTKSRPEIVIEGSNDGQEWREYEFKYKPGPLDRRPPFVAPHQPRLDWQMWFAALGSFQQNYWVGNVMLRLFEGSPEVLAAFSHNPFAEKPPRYLRALYYEYEFTKPGEIFTEGRWWKRRLLGNYTPAFERPQ
jgi:lipase maturation factor 1